MGEDLDFVRGVSILGLGQTAGWSEAKIDRCLTEEELTREETIRRVKVVEAKLRIDLLEADGVTLRI